MSDILDSLLGGSTASYAGLSEKDRLKLYAMQQAQGTMAAAPESQDQLPSPESPIYSQLMGNSGMTPSEAMLKNGFRPNAGAWARGSVEVPLGNGLNAGVGGVVAQGQDFAARPVSADASLSQNLSPNSSIIARLTKLLMDQRPMAANISYQRRF